MSLEFRDAIFGTEKDFEAAHLETCGVCSGSGARSGTSSKTCPTCGGMGQVMRTQDTPFGTFSQVCTSVFEYKILDAEMVLDEDIFIVIFLGDFFSLTSRTFKKVTQ